MIHTNMPRNCTVFLLPRRLTRSTIYGSQILDSDKWPTVLVRTVKGKPRNFEANLCGSLYSTFRTSFQPYAFYKKWLQTLFIDQLVRSKATCSFKVINFCFLPIHRCVWPLYTQYFPKSCEKINYSGGIRTHNPCISRAVPYQLDYRGCPVARGSWNPMF